jgi:Luciferase-like monooxygenase
VRSVQAGQGDGVLARDTRRADASTPMRLTFGPSITPTAVDIACHREQVRVVKETGLDLVGIQDHPESAPSVDTWSVIAVWLTEARRLRVFPNVASLPLRPPAMMGTVAASLDLWSGGAGSSWGLDADAFWRPTSHRAVVADMSAHDRKRFGQGEETGASTAARNRAAASVPGGGGLIVERNRIAEFKEVAELMPDDPVVRFGLAGRLPGCRATGGGRARIRGDHPAHTRRLGGASWPRSRVGAGGAPGRG